MSKIKVYPWTQVASDIAAANGYDEVALAAFDHKLSDDRRRDGEDAVDETGGFVDLDKYGRDPAQVAARTDIAQVVWMGLRGGSLPAYYPDGIRMPVDEVLTAGVNLKGVCVEPVSANALLKVAAHPDCLWTPEVAHTQPGYGRGVSAQAKQEEEILEILRCKGYDPRRLPKNPPGKRGVKSEIREAVGHNGAWSGSTVFKKAWDRLLASGEVAYG